MESLKATSVVLKQVESGLLHGPRQLALALGRIESERRRADVHPIQIPLSSRPNSPSIPSKFSFHPVQTLLPSCPNSPSILSKLSFHPVQTLLPSCPNSPSILSKPPFHPVQTPLPCPLYTEHTSNPPPPALLWNRNRGQRRNRNRQTDRETHTGIQQS